MNTQLFKDADFPFWKNLVFVFIFLTITPLTLLVSLFSLISLSRIQNYASNSKQATPSVIKVPISGVQVFASLPSTLPSYSYNLEALDGRVLLIKNYLNKYKSPLLPYAQNIVTLSDNFGLDYRLTTAIAQQESNLCKKIPDYSYNCWGWGIHSKGTLGFISFEDGLYKVSRGIKEDYIDRGYITIEEIMSKYTPRSDGSWAFGVNQFMEEIENVN